MKAVYVKKGREFYDDLEDKHYKLVRTDFKIVDQVHNNVKVPIASAILDDVYETD